MEQIFAYAFVHMMSKVAFIMLIYDANSLMHKPDYKRRQTKSLSVLICHFFQPMHSRMEVSWEVLVAPMPEENCIHV